MANRVLLELLDRFRSARIRAGYQFQCKRVELLVHVIHGSKPEQTRIGPGETTVTSRRWRIGIQG